MEYALHAPNKKSQEHIVQNVKEAEGSNTFQLFATKNKNNKNKKNNKKNYEHVTRNTIVCI